MKHMFLSILGAYKFVYSILKMKYQLKRVHLNILDKINNKTY